MLERKDLDAIKQILKEEISESGKQFGTVLDSRIGETEKQFGTMLDTRIAETEKQFGTMLDTRIAETEKQFGTVLDTKIAKSENLVLEEMERTRNILEKQIDKVRRNLEELHQYYTITKLENDNTALLLKMIDELERRVSELEKRTA